MNGTQPEVGRRPPAAQPGRVRQWLCASAGCGATSNAWYARPAAHGSSSRAASSTARTRNGMCRVRPKRRSGTVSRLNSRHSCSVTASGTARIPGLACAWCAQPSGASGVWMRLNGSRSASVCGYRARRAVPRTDRPFALQCKSPRKIRRGAATRVDRDGRRRHSPRRACVWSVSEEQGKSG